jgi:hypothetical protein
MSETDGGRLGVFGYGSLASPTSASLTLGRPIELAGVARLVGWRRRWSLARDNLATEKTFAPAGGGEPFPHCIGLNIERDPRTPAEAAPNGALIRVSQAELERLDLREMRYDRVDVTDDIVLAGGGRAGDLGLRRVFAWTGKAQHRFTTAPEGAVVIRRYTEALDRAFAELGADQLELFHATTDVLPVAAVDAVLVRDRIPAGNPRDW